MKMKATPSDPANFDVGAKGQPVLVSEEAKLQRVRNMAASPTTETPISTSEAPVADVAVLPLESNNTYLRLVIEPKHEDRREYRISVGAADVLFHELVGLGAGAPMPDMQFDPAPGVDLSDAYADRMAVRVERDEINKAGRDALHGGTGFALVTEEGTKHVPREEVLIDQPGRQTSPELAALAGRYVKVDADLLLGLSPTTAAVLAADVRRLAASVLSQVNG